MSIDEEKDLSMKEFLEQGYDFKRIHEGDLIKGKVIKITEEEVFVNIGYIADGIIPKEELSEDYNLSPKELLNPEDEIDVMILSNNDGEGNVLLSKKRVDSIKAWDMLQDSLENGSTFEVTVKDAVKGGVTCAVNGIRAFIPISQLAIRGVTDAKEYLNKKLEVKVIELDRDRNNVVLSRKEVEKQEEKVEAERIWKSLKKGEKRQGTIVRLAKFGAFVDLGGLQGLIHISDLAWKRVSDPAEVVSVGDEVEVYVLDFDRKKERISLALKEVSYDPWNNIRDKYKVNDIIEGRVVNLLNFGAFIEIAPGIEGLVHLSDICGEKIAKPSEVLNLDDKVKVKIMEIDFDNKKISLSIKDANQSGEDYDKYNEESSNLTLGDLLGDKLKGLKLD